jgi:hypothetical protein
MTNSENYAWKFTYRGLTMYAPLSDSKYVPAGRVLVTMPERAKKLPNRWLNEGLPAMDLAYSLLEMLDQEGDGLIEIPIVAYSNQTPHEFLPSSAIAEKTPGHDMMTEFISRHTDTYTILKSEAAAAARQWLNSIESEYAHNPQ